MLIWEGHFYIYETLYNRYWAQHFIEVMVKVMNIGPQWKSSSVFWRTPPNSIGFHCKIGFFSIKMDSRKFSMYCFFWVPEGAFILCIVFSLPIPEDAFWGRNYRFCILCIPSWLYIFLKKKHTHDYTCQHTHTRQNWIF